MSAQNPAVQKLHFGGYQPAASIHTKAVRRLGDILERELGGGIAFEQTVSILDLGHKAGDLVGLVESGAFSMCYVSSIRFSGQIEALRLFDTPFVIGDRARVFRELDGNFGETLKAAFAAKTPYRLLGFWDNGFRQISNRLRPIHSPADCRGMTIRTQPNGDIGEAMGLLGFTPVPTDIKVAIEELTAGRIDAQENPLTSINAFGIQKLHRHITLTSHIFGVALVLCNADVWKSWPADFRAALQTALADASQFQRALAAEQDIALLDAFEREGVGIVHLDDSERHAFIEAAAPLVRRMTADIDPELLERLRG